MAVVSTTGIFDGDSLRVVDASTFPCSRRAIVKLQFVSTIFCYLMQEDKGPLTGVSCTRCIAGEYAKRQPCNEETAGLMIANRLPENECISLLVLKAGSSRIKDPRITVPGLSSVS